MKIIAKELNLFWDEVLGLDWYVEEGAEDWTCDEPPDAIIEIEDYAYLGWQGDGEETLTPLMESMLRRDSTREVYNIKELYEEWKKSQTRSFLLVEVPHEKREAFEAFLAANGMSIPEGA